MTEKKHKGKKDWWFALSNGVKDDPKVLLLPNDTLRWQWIVLLCAASSNDGKIASLDVAAVALRMSPVKAAQVIAALQKARLLDDDSQNGGYFSAHDWEDHRPKRNKGQATNAERQAAYRERHQSESNGNVTAENAVTRNAEITAPTLITTEKKEREVPREAARSDENVSHETFQPVPVESPKGLPASYAFDGDVIRLKKSDFDNWVKAYPRIDLRAELTARDAWLATAGARDRERWFVSTAAHLRNQNAKAAKGESFKWASGIEGVY